MCIGPLAPKTPSLPPVQAAPTRADPSIAAAAAAEEARIRRLRGRGSTKKTVGLDTGFGDDANRETATLLGGN